MSRPVLSARHFAVLTLAFTIFVVYGSFVPLTMRALSWDSATERYEKAMSKPVRIESKSDFAANVMLFVPLGFLAAGAIGVDRKRPLALVALIPAMAALSAAIEFGQLCFPDRNTTINDVAAETIGGVVGVGLWHLFGQNATNRFRSAWAQLGPGDWAVKALPAYLIFLVIVHGMPFDMTLSPWQIKKKYDHGREIDAEASGAPTIDVLPYPRQVFEKTLLNIAYFVPAGALLSQLPSRRWRMRESASRVLGIGFVIALGIETVQLIVMSAGTYASDIVCGALLILLGWWLAIRPRPMTSQVWASLAVAWAVALAICFWSPFVLAERIAAFEWMPFADYFRGNYIGAFNRIINKIVLFVPLGFLLCRAWPLPVWSSAIAGAMLSAVIEVGQVAITAGSGSVSDVVLGTIGGWIGGIIAIRVRSQPTTQQSINANQ